MKAPSLKIRSGMIALVVIGAAITGAAPAYAGTTDIDLMGRGYDCTPFTSSTGQQKLLCTKQGSPPQICDDRGDHCHEAALQTGPLSNVGPRPVVLEQQQGARPARSTFVARRTAVRRQP